MSYRSTVSAQLRRIGARLDLLRDPGRGVILSARAPARQVWRLNGRKVLEVAVWLDGFGNELAAEEAWSMLALMVGKGLAHEEGQP